MIDIKLDGGYRIYNQDELSVILSRTCMVTNPKSKNCGQEREKVLGYYGSLRQALDGYTKHRMMDGETDLSGSVEKIVAELEKVKSAVESAASAVKE